MKLLDHHYGKSRVRVLKVMRAGQVHTVKELEVAIQLKGDFHLSYTSADNRAVVATDTMKNVVYALAKDHLAEETEKFAVALGNFFLDRYTHVSQADILVKETLWSRMQVSGKPHPHSFTRSQQMKPFARVTCSRNQTGVESGVEDVVILKSTASGFADFYRDAYTTLPETKERLLATRLKARWLFEELPADYAAANQAILQAMLQTFADDYSPSVQRTLYQMGEAALHAVSAVSRIHLSMPNLHCLLVNLEPFALENRNEIFAPTDAPYGLIQATVSRNSS